MMIPSNISKTGQQSAAEKSTNEQPVREEAGDAAIKRGISPQAPNRISDLALSESIGVAMKSAEFDLDKVNQISEAIRMGNYPLDARKIAESFIPLEQLL